MNSTRNRTRHQYNPSLENRMAKSEELQELKEKLKKESVNLVNEMKAEHVPIFYNWINCKLQCIDETLKFVDHNPILSIN